MRGNKLVVCTNAFSKCFSLETFTVEKPLSDHSRPFKRHKWWKYFLSFRIYCACPVWCLALCRATPMRECVQYLIGFVCACRGCIIKKHKSSNMSDNMQRRVIHLGWFSDRLCCNSSWQVEIWWIMRSIGSHLGIILKWNYMEQFGIKAESIICSEERRCTHRTAVGVWYSSFYFFLLNYICSGCS